MRLVVIFAGLAVLLFAGAASAANSADLFDDEVVDEEPPAPVEEKAKPRRAPKQQPQPVEPDEEFDRGKQEAAKGGQQTDAKAEERTAQAEERKAQARRKLEAAHKARIEARAAGPALPLVGPMEMLGLLFIAVYGLNYLWGRRTNVAFAQRWGEVFNELLETQFSQVGDDDAIMAQESADTFTIDATGRERCDWLQAKLQLSSRQDLYKVLQGVLAPRPDKLTLDIAIAEDEVDAYVLAVLDKRLDKAHVQELHDLKTLTSQCSVGDAGLPASVRVLCEQREIATELLGGEVGATLAAHAELFEQIHLSDFVPAAWGLPSGTKRALHIVFRLPSGGGAAAVEATRPMLRAALLLLDKIGRLRLSQPLKDKLKKGRSTVEALKFKDGHKERQEAAQQRKAEKLAEKKNKEPLANREAQRKREEKEARQAAKKKGPRMKMK
tara:strand:+ start:4179 stop:5498 length:1320 start_codon:yes stop_codon:yes gene_type:complete